MVASTTGTAPRSPAQDRKSCSRRFTRNGSAEIATDNGRASSSSASPVITAGSTAASSRLGDTSRPSSTNRPIWASQASPSAKPRMACRCGSLELPSSTPAT